jgi:hypothetical protein
MGFTCDACHSEPATLHCFADKASLCRACDSRMHAAKQAGQKHERVALTPLNEPTQCDICQEHPAVMFCSEDRALICRRCDLMIHTANEFTKTHHRYILSNVAAGLHGLPEPSSSGASSAAETTTNIQRGGASAMPRIQPSSSSGELLNMPRLPTGAVLMGAPSADAPVPLQASQPEADGAQAALGGGIGSGAFSSGGSGAGASRDAGGASASAAERSTSVTLAADLLGMPSLPPNYSAKDVDAAWGDAGLGDFDDWSRFLEVPDLGFLHDDAAGDWFGGGGGASQPADGSIFDDPVVSVRDPTLVTSAVPSSAPAAQPKAGGIGPAGGGRDSLVPEVPSLKRPRIG